MLGRSTGCCLLAMTFWGWWSPQGISGPQNAEPSAWGQVGWVSSGRKVFPDTQAPAGGWAAEGRLSLAGHEYEAVQLLVSPTRALKQVTVTFSPLTRQGGGGVLPAACITPGLVESVLVQGKRWPDPIVPYHAFDVGAGRTQPVWVCVYAPPETPAGVYVSEVTLRADGLAPVTRRLAVTVRGFTLPVTGTLKTLASWEMNPAYRQLLLRYRHQPGGSLVGAGEITGPACVLTRDGKIRFDWTAYDREMATCFAQGMTCFGLPWRAGDGTGLEPYRMEYPFLDERTGKQVRLSLNPLAGPAEAARMGDWFRQFAAHLREKGWLDRAVVYLWDEPGPNHNPEILALARAVKKADPGLKIMLTEWPVDELFPVVDIFCTHVVNFRDAHLPVMRRAQAKGKALWWYSCSPDPYPSPSYNIPHDNTLLRSMSWLTWKLDLPGSLYFTFAWNRGQDPYVSPGADGKGDGLLVYPFKDGQPVVSVRLEMLRDGIEDYEYLAILKRRIAAAKAGGVAADLIGAASALLVVPAEIAVSADTYTTDPEVIDRQRAKIASMIERLDAATLEASRAVPLKPDGGAARLLLKKGDRMIMAGDSITEQQIYTRDVELYLSACTPQLDLWMMQIGKGGEEAPAFLDRMDRDLLPFKPNVMTLCYGMNDGKYIAFRGDLAEVYKTYLTAVIKKAQGAGMVPVLGSPGAVDSVHFKICAPAVYNDTLQKLGGIGRQIAQENGLVFANVHEAMMAAMAPAKGAFGPAYSLAGTDGIHPSENGHLVMAYAFLKALGLDGQLATFTLDMKGSARASDGHRILSCKDGRVEIESTRYPFCFGGSTTSPDGTISILPFVPFNHDLNNFRLQVKNLSGSRAAVTWGATTKRFTRQQLETGINLAAEFIDNPFQDAFARVGQAVAQKQRFEMLMLRQFFPSLEKVRQESSYAETATIIGMLQERLIVQQAELEKRVKASVIPVKHTILVTPEA